MVRRTAAGLALVATGVVLAGASPAAAGRADEARTLLADLNARWVGADARMRVSIPIKKKVDRDGWSESRWMCSAARTDKDQGFCFRVRVSNRRALGRLLAGGNLPAGLRARPVGWGFEEPDRAKGLYLDLEIADAPAHMRWVFTTGGMSTRNAVKAEELVHVERYLRIDAFELRPPAEQLVAVAPPATPTPVPRPPTPTPTPVVLRPELGLVTTDVRPPRVRPGGEVRLVLTYQIAGIASGATREVTEIRRIVVGDDEVEQFEHVLRRPAGTVTSELPVRVPDDATSGIYSVGTTVRLAGAPSASDTAFFVVSTAGGAP